VQQSVVKSTHLDFMELIRGSIFWARKVGTNRAQRCEAQLSGFTSLSKILRPLSGPRKRPTN